MKRAPRDKREMIMISRELQTVRHNLLKTVLAFGMVASLVLSCCWMPDVMPSVSWGEAQVDTVAMTPVSELTQDASVKTGSQDAQSSTVPEPELESDSVQVSEKSDKMEKDTPKTPAKNAGLKNDVRKSRFGDQNPP